MTEKALFQALPSTALNRPKVVTDDGRATAESNRITITAIPDRAAPGTSRLIRTGRALATRSGISPTIPSNNGEIRISIPGDNRVSHTIAPPRPAGLRSRITDRWD